MKKINFFDEERLFFDLKNLYEGFGYKHFKMGKFEEYGVPQARHRVIIVGIREDLPYEFRIPSTAPYANIDVSCKTAIEKPPIPSDAYNNEMTKQSPAVVERLQHIKPGQNAQHC